MDEVDQAGRSREVARELLRYRAEFRSEGGTTLGGRIVVLGDDPLVGLVAEALLATGAQELALDCAGAAVEEAAARLRAAHPSRSVEVRCGDELREPWQSAHGVIDARRAAGPLPFERELLPDGAWLTRFERDGDALRLVAG